MKKKYLMALISIATLFSLSFTTVYAKNIADSTATSVNQDIEENSDNSCKVTVSQGSSFIVSIPKDVSLAGKKAEVNEGTYTIVVKGNIDATEVVNVIPDASFKLKDDTGRKADITANVTQNVQSFQIGDTESSSKVTVTEENIVTGVSTSGTISTKELSAGNWTGFFNIKISLV